MKPMHETLLKAAVGALVGGVVAWSASALTLAGRVTAIEQSLIRIEARLYAPPAK